MRIKEVADRTGFSAPTLRYYEELGLLPPAARTPAGYRSYDEATIERLAFIGRAKQLGCSLEEIADLITAWDGGRCGPVQDHLRALVAEKQVTAQARIVELMTIVRDLGRAATALERHRPDGPCDDRCGCLADPAGVGAPIACTLAAESLPARLDDWRALLGHADRRSLLDDGVRVELEPATPLEELVRLVAAEQACCPFFRFAVTVDDRGLGLEVRGPADARAVIESLFGSAASRSPSA